MIASPPGYTPDRRPLTFRDLAISRRVTTWLVRCRVSPNAISLAGMLGGIAAGATLALTHGSRWAPALFLAAIAGMVLRMLANMFDGMVAIESGIASPVGELYNEVPDRVSDSAILIGAGYAQGGVPELGYVAALLAVFLAYVRAQGKAAGGPYEFCGPMAKPQRMYIMTAAALLSACLPVDLALAQVSMGCCSMRLTPVTVGLIVIILGAVVTALRRLRRTGRALRGAA